MARPGGAGAPTGPPLSFKTVPGRNRTQKWQQAKTYNYDGDDWGGYDPYDDYGGGNEPQPASSYAGPAPSSRANRATSFDRGDERRNFSAGPILYEEEVPEATAVKPDPVRTRPRDFTSPEHVPAPLSTRGSPSPVRFPPRKSSITSDNAPNLTQQDPTQVQGRASADDKPLPFIRPSDIYKRVAEEREKEKTSMDSSRPSMDSIRREVPSATNQSASASSDSLPSATGAPRANLQPLQEQAEPDTPLRTTFPTNSVVSSTPVGDLSSGPRSSALPSQSSAIQRSPVLPEVSRISTFGNDFWSGTSSINTSDPMPDTAAKQAPAEPTSTGAAADLQHQPSVGLRSVVHTAFDRKPDSSVPDTPVSREDSRSTTTASGVSRSNTDSTAGISPIMSSMPVSLAAQLQQQDGSKIPSIAEETSSAGTATQRRPLPEESRTATNPLSSENRPMSGNIPIGVVGFQPGYRRSLDPPSKENSPAHTPHVEDTASKRLSGPLVATVDTDGQADIATAELKSMSSGNSKISDTIDEYTKALPVKSRGRSGTNLSLREADLADAVSASPENSSAIPAAAHAQNIAREQFLREHENPKTIAPSPINTEGITSSSTTGQDSPTKGRVREIAGKYQDIHEASRRGSQATLGSRKSSWSNFRGSEEDLTLKQGPASDSIGPVVSKDHSSDDKNMFPKYENSNPNPNPNALALPSDAAARTGAESQQSFRPQMPGGWQSAVPTPATEQPPVVDASTKAASSSGEDVDLSPTTKKEPLVGGHSNEAGFAVKSAGAALGASLLATAGLNSKAQDFASKDTQPVEQPGMQPKPSVGAIRSQPPLLRGDSEITDAPTSAATSRPPTPPAKDETLHDNTTIAPLKFGQKQPGNVDGLATTSASVTDVKNAGITDTTKHMSTDAANADTESDRLRKEIVRSLDGSQTTADDNLPRVQDGLDAPTNQRLAEQGQTPRPATETQSRPHLPQRFSWEEPLDDIRSTAPTQGALTLPTITEPAQLPEIMPEMPYERPRSKELHVVNDPDGEPVASPVSPLEEGFAADTSVSLSQAANTTLPLAEVKDGAQLNDGTPNYQFAEFDTPELGAPKDVKNDDGAVAGSAGETPAKQPETPRQQRSPSSGQRIPPTREILALKSASDRISAYDHTRRTYAQMDTGLSDWLGRLAVQHPDISSTGGGSASDFGRPAIQTTSPGAFGGKHKHSPSLMNFTNQFRSGAGDGSPSGKRKASMSGQNPTTPDPAVTPGRETAADGEGKRMNVDMDKMQQRGKDLIKNANILGGKAQAGAKGLFAKGKSRFGKREQKVTTQSPARPLNAEQPPMNVADKQSLAGMPESAAPSFPTALHVSESRTSTSDPVHGPVSHEYNAMPRPPVPEKDPRLQTKQSEDDADMAISSGMSRPLSLVAHTSTRPGPPPRSNSQTPSSHSNSLSRTISRLSRSISRSSRSRSRPVSIAVADHHHVALPTDAQAPFPQQTSIDIPNGPEAAHSLSPATGPAFSAPFTGKINRREVWAEKSATLPVVPQDADTTPERLGVLPSPGLSFFDRPFTAHTSDSEKTPTQPKKFSLSVASIPQQSMDDIARSTPPLDNDLDSITPTAKRTHERDVTSPVTPSKSSLAEPSFEQVSLPQPGATELGLATVTETSRDDALERESNASTVDHFEDARDTFAPEAVVAESRRTSVSSLEDRRQDPRHLPQGQGLSQGSERFLSEEPLATPGVPPAVPPKDLPASTDSLEPLQPSVSPMEQHVAPASTASTNEPVLRRPPGLEERPLSFMVAPRDAQGIPIEQVNRVPDPVDTRTPVHTAVANHRSRASGEVTRTPRPVSEIPRPRRRDQSAPRVDRTEPMDDDIAQMNRESRFHMSDQYGLEGLAVSGPDAVKTDEEDQSLADSTDATRRRRSSGIWQKIRSSSRKRSSSRPVSMVALDTSTGHVQGQDFKEDIPPVPQHPLIAAQPVLRADTTIMPQTEEPQKKRRSMLASLFGKSNTEKSPQSSPISKKLTKKAQSGKRMSSQNTMPGSIESRVEGSVDYQTFEAIRRQQQPPPQARAQMQRPRKSEEERRRQSLPVMGFTPPADRPPLPFEEAGRRMADSRSQTNIPPAFRPTEAGYGRNMAPIGPPPERRVVSDMPSPNRQPTLPTEHESWLRQGAQQRYNPQQHEQRMRSYGDQLPGQPRLPQPNHETHRGAPIANIPRQRQRSEGQVQARSPAKEYHDQQTPWTIDLPGQQRPRHPSHEQAYQANSGEMETRHWPLPPHHQHYQYAHDGEERYMNGNERRRHYQEEEAIPKMSATSYPGQEWVPQGLGRETFD